MAFSVREYHASQRLEINAHQFREEYGANQFFSLLFALYRVAGSEEIEKLETIFPGTLKELSTRYAAPAGLMPGESWREENLLVSMDANGKVDVKEV